MARLSQQSSRHSTNDQGSQNQSRHFNRLVQEAHAQCKLSITIAAELAGLSPSYLCDLLAGRRYFIHLYRLKRLCTYVWRLDRPGSLLIFSARIALEAKTQRHLPVEFFWRIAEYPDLNSLARAAHLSKSHVARILRNCRRPTYQSFAALAEAIGYKPAEIGTLFVALHR